MSRQRPHGQLNDVGEQYRARLGLSIRNAAREAVRPAGHVPLRPEPGTVSGMLAGRSVSA